jgi:UDP-N-acetylglucosamine 2-epimerase (non-hydrolysing)
MAPVIHALSASPHFDAVTCVTAQHRQMLDAMTALFGLRVDYDLDLMQPGQSLNGLASAVFDGIEKVIREVRPDVVLVQGDTTTTMATAVAAFHERVPVGHVEAGLRTGNLDAPWPEEANRRLATVVTRYHFSPTEKARANLLNEGVAPDAVWVTGNTVVDALCWMRERLASDHRMRSGLEEQFNFLDPYRSLVLVTGHRRESFGEGFHRICEALRLLAQRGDAEILYPVHLNPNVRGPVHEILGGHPRIHLIEPVGYAQFVHLMERARLILTDSGGVQEEAPTMGTPLLVMRDTTERPEVIEAGFAQLVGTDPGRIVREATRLLDQPIPFAGRNGVSPFGDGHAAERIVEVLSGVLSPAQRLAATA